MEKLSNQYVSNFTLLKTANRPETFNGTMFQHK
jgi:hypothetical protein